MTDTDLLGDKVKDVETQKNLEPSLKVEWDKKTLIQKAYATLDYLNRVAGQKFTTVNPKGQPTAHAKLVLDRLKDGYIKDDFKKVISGQHRQWAGDDKMSKYMRPSTLFRKSNFENYLDTAGVPAAQRNETDNKPPDVLDELVAFLTYWKDRRQPWGFSMPESFVAAAIWWKDKMQAPAEKHEAARQTTKKFGRSAGDTVWDFPYLDRLKYTLRLYMLLPAVDQKIVFGCTEEGVFWRGDNMDIFYNSDYSIYQEHLKMQEMGIEQYKLQHKPAARQFLEKTNGSTEEDSSTQKTNQEKSATEEAAAD